MAKSYWQEVYIDSPSAKENVKSWFGFMCARAAAKLFPSAES